MEIVADSESFPGLLFVAPCELRAVAENHSIFFDACRRRNIAAEAFEIDVGLLPGRIGSGPAKVWGRRLALLLEALGAG